MTKITSICIIIISLLMIQSSFAQDYFLKDKGPFDASIPSPEEFLGYGIGEQHTRHDQIVAYFQKLADISDKASIEVYGYTHERRKLVMLTISSENNMANLPSIKEKHLQFVDPNDSSSNFGEVPIFIQLGYNVHGNEPSSAEAAILTAYTLLASQSEEVKNYLQNSVIFIDPNINPDGRDRHTQWANQYKSNQLVSDNYDAEHNEAWPRGRTNHFWFDLNRDWLLAVNPESKGKLKWYHEWYPNVVTDFHEMGSESNYFFEPMKPIGSQDPILPKENYQHLNDLFGTYYSSALDNIGSFYFTKEAFDGTYPGYGSSYPDLQGGLALLFEQASSRGHVQDTDYGTITFPFTIRNQYTSSITTIKAAVENKEMLRKYQQKFFKSAIDQKDKSGFIGYQFGDKYDQNRNKAFVDFLKLHEIKVYKSGENYVVPVAQPQHRMVQTMFETYNKYRDSVFYDASAWSMSNFYNMKSSGLKSLKLGEEITDTDYINKVVSVPQTSYAYIMDWDDYYAPAALYYMQSQGLIGASAFKPFSSKTNVGEKDFNYGSVLIPVSKQKKSIDEVYKIVKEAQDKYKVPIFSVSSGFSTKGIDLGSGNFKSMEKPEVAMLIGEGVSSSEAGEVWHLLDTRIDMPISKIRMASYGRTDLDDYNTLIMVSGSYDDLDSLKVKALKDWVSSGNTIITIAGGSKWAIDKKLVKEELTKEPKEKDSLKNVDRLPYVEASENLGREELGGAIFEVDLDITHPLGFGYHDKKLPVYKNNNVFLAPSKNEYSTVAKYTDNAHIDGFISTKNYETFLKPSASIIVSPIGSGRVIMFADNPNFRGAWYGTNRLFLNAIFLGEEISVPQD